MLRHSLFGLSPSHLSIIRIHRIPLGAQEHIDHMEQGFHMVFLFGLIYPSINLFILVFQSRASQYKYPWGHYYEPLLAAK